MVIDDPNGGPLEQDDRPPLIWQALMHAAVTGDPEMGSEVLGTLNAARARKLAWVLARLLASFIVDGFDLEDTQAPDDASALMTDDDPRGDTTP